jgi:hypothetical protein
LKKGETEAKKEDGGGDLKDQFKKGLADAGLEVS